MALNGPLYARLQGERLQLGFRVEARHTNPLNICHGGMLATFADMLLPCVAMYQSGTERRFLPTISLQIDYLASAAPGAWVQGEGEVLRTTRNMVFVQGLVTADARAGDAHQRDLQAGRPDRRRQRSRPAETPGLGKDPFQSVEQLALGSAAVCAGLRAG